MNVRAAEFYETGMSLMELEEWQEALESFEAAVELDPDNAEYHAQLALAHYQLDECDAGVQSACKAIALDPACAEAYRARGLLLYFFFDDRYEDALEDATRAINTDPSSHRAYALRGKIHLELKDYVRAADDFQQAVWLAPGHLSAQRGLGTALFHQDRLEQAIHHLTKALKLDPSDTWSRFLRGAAYGVLEQYSQAVTDLGVAIEALSDRPEVQAQAYDLRSIAHENLGNYRQSIIDGARAYQFIRKDSLADRVGSDLLFWAETVHEHFVDSVLPQLEVDGERFIEYAPCMLLWNERVEDKVFSGTSTEYRYGTYGTGYACFTDRSIRLFVLAKLTQEYPLVTRSVGKGLLGLLTQKEDRRNAETQDRRWIIPHSTISGAQEVDEHILLVTPAMEWRLYISSEDVPWAMTVMNMAISGQLTQIERPRDADKQPSSDPSGSAEIVSLLRQLRELERSGVITETEFEQKKRELLERI